MQTDDIAAWLTGIWDEDEARLSEPTFCGPVWPTTDHLLARIAADRQTLLVHGVAWNAEVCTICHHYPDGETPEPVTWPCLTVRILALPHADRPSYREEWRP